ncbi:MAG: hypothetical protein ACI9YU_000115 [Flavobacteriales bacterium]|jgi:hypothetical protein
MKKLLFTFAIALTSLLTNAQAPSAFSYQAVVRDASNDLVVSSVVGMQISILQGSRTGAPVYVETHIPTTNANGLISLQIGGGALVSGNFSAIDWNNGPYVIKTETDPTGGTSYTIAGTQQLLNVPYALYANTAETVTTALSVNTTDELQNLSISGDTIFISSGNYVVLPPLVPGCTDPSYFEYNPLADTSDGSCLNLIVNGCTDPTAINYDVNANSDDGSCIPYVYGCTDPLYTEYNAAANTDDGTCATLRVYGCTNSNASNYNALANTEDGSCLGIIYGCTDPNYINYNPLANTNNGTCATLIVNGCTNSLYTEYYPLANTDDGSCATLVVNGCTAPTAINYNPLANTDDGSCIINGCTDPYSINYNPLANTDDGSCIPFVIGQTYQGGILFYLDGSGGGLIAAPYDQSTAAEWGCFYFDVPGADGTAIGTGAQNTIDIVNANCSPNTLGSQIAANICANLTLGGYSDWFLPSQFELNEMYLNIGQGNALGLGNIGGFAYNAYSNYWSSTEDYTNTAWGQYFYDGDLRFVYKAASFNVRAVRAF